MTLTLEIPDDLASYLGPDVARLLREALALEAHRRGLWTEFQLGEFLGIHRMVRDQFLKDHGVELEYTWEDVERDRAVHREIAARREVAGR